MLTTIAGWLIKGYWLLAVKIVLSCRQLILYCLFYNTSFIIKDSNITEYVLEHFT